MDDKQLVCGFIATSDDDFDITYRHAKRQTTEQYRDNHRELVLASYGLTVADEKRMMAEQGRVCAICSNPPPRGHRLAIDHDHKTGKVRGLLCKACNIGLGAFNDNATSLHKAALYIKRAQKKHEQENKPD